jgi:hypothetical protein
MSTRIIIEKPKNTPNPVIHLLQPICHIPLNHICTDLNHTFTEPEKLKHRTTDTRPDNTSNPFSTSIFGRSCHTRSRHEIRLMSNPASTVNRVESCDREYLRMTMSPNDGVDFLVQVGITGETNFVKRPMDGHISVELQGQSNGEWIVRKLQRDMSEKLRKSPTYGRIKDILVTWIRSSSQSKSLWMKRARGDCQQHLRNRSRISKAIWGWSEGYAISAQGNRCCKDIIRHGRRTSLLIRYPMRYWPHWSNMLQWCYLKIGMVAAGEFIRMFVHMGQMSGDLRASVRTTRTSTTSRKGAGGAICSDRWNHVELSNRGFNQILI